MTFGDNSKGKIIDLGNILIIPSTCIENILVVEGLIHNLLCINKLCDRGFSVSFKSSHYIVTSSLDNSIKFIGKKHGNVYIVDFDELKNENIECFVAMNVKVNEFTWIWHNRLGHASIDLSARLIKLDLVKDLPKINFEKNKICKAYQLDK